ncbi:hypothetical protein [Flavobacterium sp. NKUCC04_CG]|uniref:hypothetical protein n=1 Tax=Flavobacterium sp. NKUCC04_CG TaxID=2842121 RepID=UPI0021022D23|nr:hypothetical protein [Flavobacterium sp. NKUCC04_CG]
MIKINNLLLLTLLTIFISCKEKNIHKNIEIENDAISFFEPADLGAFGSKTRLLIYANFDECGEWGGHTESFEIFSKKDRIFYAKYIRTRVDCDKIGELYGSPEFQQPDRTTEFQLTKNNISAINDYLSKLLKSKIHERFPGHAGQNFGVIKSDSTLIIDVYDSNKANLNNYNTLLKAFDIEEVNYEYR